MAANALTPTSATIAKVPIKKVLAPLSLVDKTLVSVDSSQVVIPLSLIWL
jgi:hypothetical protein